MIQDTRIRRRNELAPADGRYVLYWMQQSQRAAFNPALEWAVREANRRKLPVVVVFGLMDDYPEATLRHYAFMLEGLAEVRRALEARGIGFVIRRGAPDEVALALASESALLVMDRGYLRHQKAWRDRVADEAGRLVVEVEGDVVVPVEVASDKHEHAARTIRPKLHRVLDDYLKDLQEQDVEVSADRLELTGDVDLDDLESVLDGLAADRTVGRVRRFKGGTSAARERLESFLEGPFDGYADGRSEPAAYQCSMLSPYLHFGQISPVEIALRVREKSGAGADDRASYLEELIVRRELSMNFVNFNDAYDRYAGLPDWARRTLAEHADDERPERYTAKQLAAGETGDRYWNAAMREMRETGYMHNYMRMYWAKKILEWSSTPEHAYETALALNNRFFLDGRDANSYANVAWTFGLHDRAWTER
ncbi:MAG: deoxyribodipyrimidine photo-lyase, partial [Geminicoccaceae bacterium]|nr:deoxyribodipyrimidine photo-lyase [Geminicoccaceae bacterium]